MTPPIGKAEARNTLPGPANPIMATSIRALAALALLHFPLCLNAQVPTFAEVAGHEIAERLAEHRHIARYLERLDESSPRVSVVDLGRSWEGRELLTAIVTSPDNHARLEGIRAASRRLADPRGVSDPEVAELIDGQPVVIWIHGSIHGDEPAGAEGLLLLLEHLTKRDDPETLAVLEHAVILIDPVINPDGRDAFVHHHHRRLSRFVHPERDAWPNDEIRHWPEEYGSWISLGFRTGHYYFDNNRDWTAQTQRATRARARMILDWRPQAVIDAHDWAAGDVEFFYSMMWGGERPIGGAASFSEAWCDEFGHAFAEALEAAQRPHLTRERFPCGLALSLPASTTEWTPWIGSVGILFEQGASWGLALTRPDGSVRTLRYAAENQYYGARALIERAAGSRARLLREFHDAHVRFLEEPEAEGVRRYILPPTGDPNLSAEAINLLLRNDIEVGVLTDEVRLGQLEDGEGRAAGERAFVPGSFIVEVAQPRLVSNLFRPTNTLTLQGLFNLEIYATRDAVALPVRAVERFLPSATDAVADALGTEWGPSESVSGDEMPGRELHRAGYAYLVPGDQAVALTAAFHLHEQGHRLSITTAATRITGRDYPSGSVVALTGDNDDSLHDAIRQIADELHLRVEVLDSGLAEAGYPSLGSTSRVPFRAPSVAMVAEDPLNGYSFGWSWFALERQYRIPVTVVRSATLGQMSLARFDTIVLTELDPQAFAALLGEAGLERLRRWIREGGTLVTLGSASDFARDQLGVIGLRSWYDSEEGVGAELLSLPDATLPIALTPASYNATARAPADWVASGYVAGRIQGVARSARVYLPPPDLESRGGYVVARYAELPSERASGGVWADPAARFEGAVYVYHERVGEGRVVAFSEDVNYRGHARGTDRLFLNAVLVSPSAR